MRVPAVGIGRMNTQKRINEIDEKRLYELCSSSFKSWLDVHDDSKVNKSNSISKIVVVGSYLTEKFREGDSDIDLYIITQEPLNRYSEKYWWQEFNDDFNLQPKMCDCIPANVEFVDCADTQDYENFDKEEIDEPFYIL